uniref:Uncharacterized protein n=1 Tax=Vespula pensylvanica TaxID=30213 RepID=A0A834U8N8_VESPE|nr:hypothetical protein H0235_009592 [Vespula pensylvanica]
MNNINIRDAIVKASQIPRTDEEIYFVRLDKPDQSWIDHNMNLKNIKVPRNIQLIETDTLDTSNNMDSKYCLNENEILSSIKAVNGGISYSNKFLEYQWKLKQMRNNLDTENVNTNISNSKTYSNCNNDVKSSNVQIINTDKSKKIENNEDSHSIQEVLKQCKLEKNALILGLLNSKQITIEDLQIPSKSNLKHETFHNHSDLQTEDIAVGNHLIQHPDDPDIYIHPLQLMEKSKKHANIMLEYVGMKEVVTPKQYYINETDNMSFEFIKKNVENNLEGII